MFLTGCPDGFFTLNGTKECFKLLDESVATWYDARSRCRAQGLDLAQPPHNSSVELRKFMLDKYGIYKLSC